MIQIAQPNLLQNVMMQAVPLVAFGCEGNLMLWKPPCATLPLPNNGSSKLPSIWQSGFRKLAPLPEALGSHFRYQCAKAGKCA